MQLDKYNTKIRNTDEILILLNKTLIRNKKERTNKI
jgi:hypothetical protein